MQQDTIFALSTPPGKSGVAVIRASGAAASDILLKLTKLSSLPPTRQATLAHLYAADGQPIDNALVIYFKAPHSFTGEDVVEFHIHGGVAIIRALSDTLNGLPGVRPAEPGEFMRRAFFAGKADLLEAEAIADMIDAETAAQLSQAAKQMQGAHSKFYKDLRGSIIEILALLEAYIDFPEEDIPEHILSDIASDIDRLKATIKSSLADNNVGERIRSGFRMSIIGAPNVGKSTLLNALANRDAAIVSAEAGTTRDVIELQIDVAGYPVLLCDTAGIRNAAGEIERLGIERSHQSLALSDIVLLMLDAGRAEETIAALSELMDGIAGKCAVLVVNKSDTVSEVKLAEVEAALTRDFADLPIVTIAAQKERGMDALVSHIKRVLDGLMPKEDVWITRARHRNLLSAAYKHLGAKVSDLPLELYCEEIRLAAVNIGKITGEVSVDELLDVIFSRFCIGK